VRRSCARAENEIQQFSRVGVCQGAAKTGFEQADGFLRRP